MRQLSITNGIFITTEILFLVIFIITNSVFQKINAMSCQDFFDLALKNIKTDKNGKIEGFNPEFHKFCCKFYCFW
jgi:hypothetical protein